MCCFEEKGKKGNPGLKGKEESIVVVELRVAAKNPR